MTAAIDSRPRGCRQPNVRPVTSAENEATADAADSASPSATGARSIPTSGIVNGSASRSCRMASARNTRTRPAPLAAHVSRHARDTASAATTGRYRAIASHSNCASPIAMAAVSTSPRPLGPASGGAVRSAHDHVMAHGRFSSHPPRTANAPRPVIHPAMRTPPPTISVVTPSTTTITVKTMAIPGAIAMASAVTISSSAVRRTRSRPPSGMTPSTRSVAAAAGSGVPMPTATRRRWTNHGTAA